MLYSTPSTTWASQLPGECVAAACINCRLCSRAGQSRVEYSTLECSNVMLSDVECRTGIDKTGYDMT